MELGSSASSVQEVVVDLRHPKQQDGWVDEFPVRPEAAARVQEDAFRIYTATRGLWTDYKVIADILGSYTASEVQLLRRAYASAFARELGADLAKRSNILKSKAIKLEQLVVRGRSELDALTVRAAVTKKVLTTELYETLCTSLPHSLVELQATYTQMFLTEAISDIERVSNAQASSSSGSLTSPGPLLVAILRNATDAMANSTEMVVDQDARDLKKALSSWTVAETLSGVINIFAKRTRLHMRKVADAYGRLMNVDLKAAIKSCFRDDLLRALLLIIEPAEEYYAHKLHGGFFGLKKTPELNKQELLGSASSKVWDTVKVTHGFTHMNTVIMVVATRFGRDLSAIAQTYRQVYGRNLIEHINDNFNYNLRLDLCRLLLAVVQGAVEHSSRDAIYAGPTATPQYSVAPPSRGW